MPLREPTSRHVVVFAGSPHAPSAIEHVEAVALAFAHWQFTVVQQHPPRPPRAAWVRAKLRRLGREPFSYPMELLEQAAGRLRRTPDRETAGRVRLPSRFEDIDLPNVAVRPCVSLHDPDTRTWVESLKPWLGLAIGAPILRPELFRIPQMGTLNLHKGLLPEYRGMPPGFWELHDGAGSTGVTVHWVDEGLDTGPVLLQRRLPIPPYATCAGLAVLLDRLGTEALVEALQEVEEREAPAEAAACCGAGAWTCAAGDALHTCGCATLTNSPDADGPIAIAEIARKATLPQARPQGVVRRRPVWRVSRRVGRALQQRRRTMMSPARRLRAMAKRIALAAYVHGWAPLRNRVRGRSGQCHATVLLYHRVSDAFLDSITVGVEQFQRQLDVLRRHYDVVDLATLLARRGQPRKRPCVAVTFDDGYADNHLAAILLRRSGMPATFFVSTGIVGSERAFPHDERALGRRVEPLSWDQIRQMADWGFDIGNHTVGHTRLSTLPADAALREIRSAEEQLGAELGRNGRLRALAYPYGRESDCTDAIRRSLPEIGVTACLSAFGGVNPPEFDPLNILRQGIDHSFSPLAFLAAVEGRRCRA